MNVIPRPISKNSKYYGPMYKCSLSIQVKYSFWISVDEAQIIVFGYWYSSRGFSLCAPDVTDRDQQCNYTVKILMKVLS